MLFFHFVQHYDTASFMHVFVSSNLFRNEIAIEAKCVFMYERVYWHIMDLLTKLNDPENVWLKGFWSGITKRINEQWLARVICRA